MTISHEARVGIERKGPLERTEAKQRQRNLRKSLRTIEFGSLEQNRIPQVKNLRDFFLLFFSLFNLSYVRQVSADLLAVKAVACKPVVVDLKAAVMDRDRHEEPVGIYQH